MENKILWKVKFEKGFYENLNKNLFSTSPKENGCFLLTRVRNNIIFVVDVIEPKQENWIVNGEDSFLPSSEYVSYSILKAELSDCGLAFVHTHPHKMHPATFSYVDEVGNSLLFKTIFPILQKPVTSFVISRHGIHGIVYANKELSVGSYHILGSNYQKIIDVDFKEKAEIDEMFSRQEIFIGREQQTSLQNLEIAIIGCGGIGSPLATQLSKMGVKKLKLFDPDKIEITNLPRIYGAKKSDVGKYKTDVIKRFIEETTDCKVEAFKTKIIGEDRDLINSDLIFGGLDNMTTRDVLNSISAKYAIPYIDSGCYIPPSKDGFSNQSWVKLHVVLPGKPCLWCTNTLNAHIIMEENLSKEEIEQRKKDGYYKTIEKQPSVISLTTFAATVAVNRLFNLINVFDSEYPVLSSWELGGGIYTEHRSEVNMKCRCVKESPFKLLLNP